MNNIRREDWETLKPTVYGWGINDVNYSTSKGCYIVEEGIKKWKTLRRCPYYIKWKDMIKRCKSIKSLKAEPSYRDCTIDEEWRYFSNFIQWVDSQSNRDWENCSLDKDFLGTDIKIYSKHTCSFIDSSLNSFVLTRNSDRGEYMLGVKVDPSNKKNPFIARCNNPYTSKPKHLGSFKTELEAHKAWQAKKHEYACLLAEQQQDPRVANALRERYAPDKDWTKV